MPSIIAPKTFISVGRFRSVTIEMTNGLRPQLTFPGIIDLENYSPEAVRILLRTINPRPEGVIVGGGVSQEIQGEVERVVKEHEVASGERIAFLAIPIGTKDIKGPEATLKLVKDELTRICGVEW